MDLFLYMLIGFLAGYGLVAFIRDIASLMVG